MRIGQRPTLPRRRALFALALSLLISGFALTERLHADDLTPATAGQLAASAQDVAHGIDLAWRDADLLLGPLTGPQGQMQLARAVGTLHQALGAPRQAGTAWRRVADLAARMQDDKQLLRALDNGLSLALSYGDYDGATVQADRLLARARSLDNLHAQASAEGYLGVIARRRGQLEAARNHQETALALRRALHDRSGEAQVMMNLGTVHRDLGDFARALELQLDALDIRKSLGSNERLDVSYRNIALLYREIEDTDQARANFEAAVAASRTHYDPQSLAGALGSYSSFLNDLGDAARALDMAEHALAIDASLGNRPYIGLEKLEIGRALATLGRTDEATRTFGEALAIGRALKHREITGGALLHLGRLALRSGDTRAAKLQLDESIALLTEAKLKAPLSEAFAVREDIAQAAGETATALNYARRRASLREELLGARSGRQLATLKARFERAESDQRIRLLSLNNEVQALRLRQQALMRNVGIGIVITMSVLLLVLAGRYRTTRRLNRALEQKNAAISAHERALEDANAKLSTHAAELYQAAITDPLTGAYNRGHLLRQLDEHVRHSLREGRDLSLLLIDFDHFKRINDEHGHLFGDRVLASGIQIIRQWLEPGDMIGRYGGEEFVVVMPDRDATSAGEVAERLRHKVADGLTALVHSPRALTISIGLASLHAAQASSIEGLIGAADVAVYRAKAQGRNRVVPYAA